MIRARPCERRTPRHSATRSGRGGDFLTARLDPSWRPGEWNPETLIFTGDPHNPRTFVYLCANPGVLESERCSIFVVPILRCQLQTAQQDADTSVPRHHATTVRSR